MDDILWQKDWCGVFIDFRDAYTQGTYATWILQFFFGSLLCNLNSVYGEWDGARSALLSILLTPHALMSSWEPWVQLHRLLPFSAYRTVTAGSFLHIMLWRGEELSECCSECFQFFQSHFPCFPSPPVNSWLVHTVDGFLPLWCFPSKSTLVIAF